MSRKFIVFSVREDSGVIEIPKQKELCSMTGKLVQISDFQDVG
jgi:hypothetical protein